MSLADIVERSRSGVFQIVFLNDKNERIGGGSAFLAKGYLITNNHVYAGHLGAHQVGIRRDDMPAGKFTVFDAHHFSRRLVVGSDQGSYDYAILNVPEVLKETDHRFLVEVPGARRIGEAVALLGFPLEHDNLTCHQGIISSFYTSGLVNVIQLDASVNAGNSGGPLIDLETGVAFGIVTRKAIGLTQLFDHLRQSMKTNIEMTQQQGMGGILIGGINVVEAFRVSQTQMLLTLDEIERQANVGIGYAFSAAHILAEPSLAAA
jgi:S1-C subfamily serine protease